MDILSVKGFEDYSLLDSGNGKRLERFGKYIVSRPDPQAIWMPKKPQSYWENADAFYVQTDGRGGWSNKNAVPAKWPVKYKNLSFYCKLTPFKHTGVFPEQSVNWDFIQRKIAEQDKQQNILNLFGYTGVASLAAAASGAKVTHLDASKPSISWAKENQKVSGLLDKPIRWILDDAAKFVQREIKRGVKYDGIIMDPPVYGHGPEGEIWDFNYSFPKLIELCNQVLSDTPIFVIVNAYAISASSIMLSNVFSDYFRELGGKTEYGELALEEQDSNRLLSTGIFARWSK